MKILKMAYVHFLNQYVKPLDIQYCTCKTDVMRVLSQ